MTDVADYLSYLMAAVGLTVLIIWPQHGPSAWLRDRLLRRVLPSAAAEVLDCYICCGFWCGLLLSPVWWWAEHRLWCWTGCLATPALFWLVLRNPTE
jgi:hypothetical protein